jgi:hypothetical protein
VNQYIPETTLTGINELCIFFALVYVKAWLVAPIASEAAYNDLLLLNQLEDYRVINVDVAKKAMSKLRNHLWYLGGELIPLAFFQSSHAKIKICDAKGENQNKLVDN